MKSTLITLKTSIIRLLILLVIATLLGYLLFEYFQPLCEPCITDTPCPPCRSKEQHAVQYITGAIDALILLRIFYLILRKKK
jgi:hypothetical protein